MSISKPHYILRCRSSEDDKPGRWWFRFRALDGSDDIEVADDEPKVRGDRLELLTVVRALESLDGPCRVSLIECSPYVRRGMRYGLTAWRENGWRWEYFGEMVPVKNHDLWQRFDRALRFHQVECRTFRVDPAHQPVGRLAHEPAQAEECGGLPIVEPITAAAEKVSVSGRSERVVEVVDFWQPLAAKTAGWAETIRRGFAATRLSRCVSRLVACGSEPKWHWSTASE